MMKIRIIRVFIVIFMLYDEDTYYTCVHCVIYGICAVVD